MTKICTKCGNEKDVSEFNTNKHQCKKCLADYHAEWYRKNYYTKVAPQQRGKYLRMKEKYNV